MPSRAGSVDDEKAAMRIAGEDLADLPIGLVKQTIRQFRIGELGDGHWRPTTADIRREVVAKLERQRRIDKSMREEAEQFRLRAEARARAERASSNSRARVHAMVDRFKAGLPADECKPAGWRPPTHAEAEEWLKAYPDGSGLPPVTTISRELADKLSPGAIDQFARETL